MPEGKRAFTPCVNLDSDSRECRIWGKPEYPPVCRDFTPQIEYCGRTAEEARRILAMIEKCTTP